MESVRAKILDSLVKVQPELALKLTRLLLDNMATYITANSDYQLFVKWLIKAQSIFEVAEVSNEWPEYYKKILTTPAVSRKPLLVKAIKGELEQGSSKSSHILSSFL
jgi:hypothetical protein